MINNTNEHRTEFKHQHTCAACSIAYGANRKDSKTCSEKCRQSLSRSKSAKLDGKRLERFTTSAFAYFLADNALRAKTIEVIPRTLTELQALHAVYRYSLSANGMGASRDFSLCHISPVTHKSRIGSLYPQNLVVAPTSLNAGYGNRVIKGAGHSILKVNLLQCWRVEEGAIKSKVILDIVRYLGNALVSKLTTSCNLQSSQRQQLLAWFHTQDDERIPSSDLLADMKTPVLTKLQTEITGKAGFNFKGYAYNADSVFCFELSRLSAYRPELLSVRQHLVLQYHAPIADPQGQRAKAQFLLLHGASVEEYTALLDEITPPAPKPLPVVKPAPRPAVHYKAPPNAWNPWDDDCDDYVETDLVGGSNSQESPTALPASPVIAGIEAASLSCDLVTLLDEGQSIYQEKSPPLHAIQRAWSCYDLAPPW